VFTRLTPILPVNSVREELTFYEQLGFERHTDPAETYPIEEFTAVACGDGILFGLACAKDPAAVPPVELDWQFETTDLESVSRAAREWGLEVTLPMTVQPWGRKMLTIRSPSGYSVTFEQA
jgi:predicted enzyme related to lactoylglutathione lyase